MIYIKVCKFCWWTLLSKATRPVCATCWARSTYKWKDVSIFKALWEKEIESLFYILQKLWKNYENIVKNVWPEWFSLYSYKTTRAIPSILWWTDKKLLHKKEAEEDMVIMLYKIDTEKRKIVSFEDMQHIIQKYYSWNINRAHNKFPSGAREKKNNISEMKEKCYYIYKKYSNIVRSMQDDPDLFDDFSTMAEQDWLDLNIILNICNNKRITEEKYNKHLLGMEISEPVWKDYSQRSKKFYIINRK